MSLATDATIIFDLLIATSATKRGDLLGLVAIKLVKTNTHRKLGLELIKSALDYGVNDT